MKISPHSYSNYLNPGLNVLKTQNTSGDWEEGMTASPPPPTKYLCLLKITLLGVEGCKQRISLNET